MSEDNDLNPNISQGVSLGELEKSAAKAALKLVGSESHIKVLDGISEMGEYYSPIIEEDVSIAKLENGLIILSDMGEFRVTRIDEYIGSYLGIAYGSAEALASEKAKTETARVYSSLHLMRKAFAYAQTDSGELDRSKLKDFMSKEAPSKFWQNQAATNVAINNITESYKVASKISSGLEVPVEVDGLMEQLEDVFRTQGMGIANLPEGATELDKKRWMNQINTLVEDGWSKWLEQAHLANATNDDHDISS